MNSFIALQYLYLLFDVDNPVNLHASNYLFTTEGHILPISNRLSQLLTRLVHHLSERFRHKSWEEEGLFGEDPPDTPSPSTFAFTNSRWFYNTYWLEKNCHSSIDLLYFSLGSLPTSQNCDSISLEQRFSLPLRQVHILLMASLYPPTFQHRNRYLQQIFAALGLA